LVVEEPAIAIPDEFERAFRAHHGLVFRTAYRITGNAADAEDVLQTVFLRLFRRTGETEAQVENVAQSGVRSAAQSGVRNAAQSGVRNEESYLRRAAVNAALDVIRSRQTERSVELADLPSGRSHSDATELRQALARAMGELQPRWAEIFALRFIEGFSNRDIANMLGISQVSVAVIIYRTRQLLKKELSQYLGERS